MDARCVGVALFIADADLQVTSEQGPAVVQVEGRDVHREPATTEWTGIGALAVHLGVLQGASSQLLPSPLTSISAGRDLAAVAVDRVADGPVVILVAVADRSTLR